MTKLEKIILLILVIAYAVSPVDLCPGPIDDIIVIVLGLALQAKGNKSNKRNCNY